MVAAHLNEPTVESAYEAYMVSYDKLPSVRAAWKRKPTFKQYMSRFGEAYTKRQNWLNRQNDTVLRDKQISDIEDALFALHNQLESIVAPTTDDEPENDDDQDDESTLIDLDELLNGHDDEPETVETLSAKLNALIAKNKAQTDDEDEDDDEPIERHVQKENEDKFPTPDMVYFYFHRAQESGAEFVTIPVRRLIASKGISAIKGGASYDKTIRSLRRKS